MVGLVGFLEDFVFKLLVLVDFEAPLVARMRICCGGSDNNVSSDLDVDAGRGFCVRNIEPWDCACVEVRRVVR